MKLHESYLERSIHSVVDALKSVTGIIYITGIGKSAHIVRKCVATWQSLSIPTHFLLAQDLLHGDIGVVRPNDVIVYVSNSGNTQELVTIASYVKRAIPVRQISLSNNQNTDIEAFVDTSICLSAQKIREADSFNKVPTVSSVLFMLTLDIVGVLLSEQRNFTDEQFRINHPSGNLHNK
jgi:arabinose-5-phosphate isomerase